MVEFNYSELLPLGKDDTPYRLLTTEHVSTAQFEGQTVLKVAPEGLELLAAAGVLSLATAAVAWTSRPNRTESSGPSSSATISAGRARSISAPTSGLSV